MRAKLVDLDEDRALDELSEGEEIVTEVAHAAGADPPRVEEVDPRQGEEADLHLVGEEDLRQVEELEPHPMEEVDLLAEDHLNGMDLPIHNRLRPDLQAGPRGRGRPPLGGDRGRPQLDERVTNRGPVSGERRDRGRGGSFPGREQGEGEPGFVGGEERRGRADIAGRGATSRESTERSHGKTETPRQRSAARKSAAAGNPEEYVGSEVDPAELFESDLEEFAAEGDVPDEQIEPDVDLSALFGDMEDQQPKGLKHAKPFRRDPDNLRPQMLYKEERELKHRREEKLGETLRRQERMDNKRDQRHDRKPRQLDPARARQIQRVLADNEGKEIHYNELMKYGRQAPEVFTPVMEDIEAVIPGLPEAHWMRSYLKTSIAAVKNNEQLTQKDRTRFVCNIVRTLQAINEKLKQNKESDSGAAGSQ
ncbi:hypothetical protein NDN08_008244 [Rhodosorus marinus]|uniref:Uncharacterized protein n=1 Tax=Rhodosorus marinus TaxID=101924 RepID=A0AAV8UZW4_9RHOD|nr:hypothetical protein NDN08_008244 [Rhodosorus marinus]